MRSKARGISSDLDVGRNRDRCSARNVDFSRRRRELILAARDQCDRVICREPAQRVPPLPSLRSYATPMRAAAISGLSVISRRICRQSTNRELEINAKHETMRRRNSRQKGSDKSAGASSPEMRWRRAADAGAHRHRVESYSPPRNVYAPISLTARLPPNIGVARPYASAELVMLGACAAESSSVS